MDSTCLNARPREATAKTSAWDARRLLDDADGTPKSCSLEWQNDEFALAGVNHLA